MSLYALILIVKVGSGTAAVVVGSNYDWAACQSAGQIAVSEDYQRSRSYRNYLCVPVYPNRLNP